MVQGKLYFGTANSIALPTKTLTVTPYTYGRRIFQFRHAS